MNAEQISHNFTFHPPVSPVAQANHLAVRSALHQAAQTISQLVPDGREKATAITKCEEAMFWACAGITRAAGNKSAE
jgi:hypothetical protein